MLPTFTRIIVLCLAALATGFHAPARAFAEDTAAPPPLVFPVACTLGESCEIQYYFDHDPGPGVRDYVGLARTTDERHDLAIRVADGNFDRGGVLVLAAADGKVTAMRDDMPDRAIRSQRSVGGRECGNGVVLEHASGWSTQYCHLRAGSVAARVKIGDVVEAGSALGEIGVSGFSEFLHLGFIVRRQGVALDPFSYGTDGRNSLWAPGQQPLPYKRGAVFRSGFAGEDFAFEVITNTRPKPASRETPALIAYVVTIGLEQGDQHALELRAPDGAIIAGGVMDSPNDQNQFLIKAGLRQPPEGWRPGTYEATYTLRRDGEDVLRRTFTTTF